MGRSVSGFDRWLSRHPRADKLAYGAGVALIWAFCVAGCLVAAWQGVSAIIEIGVGEVVAAALGILFLMGVLFVVQRLGSAASGRGLTIRQLLREGITGRPTERTVELEKAKRALAKAETALLRAQVALQTEGQAVSKVRQELATADQLLARDRILALEEDRTVRQVHNFTATRLEAMEADLRKAEAAWSSAQAARDAAERELNRTWAEGFRSRRGRG